MKKNIALENALKNKIREIGTIVPDDTVDAYVDLLFEICPQELEQNVWEWIEDKEEYTDIKYMGLSINDLINMGYDKKYFFRLIDVLNRINLIFYGDYDIPIINMLYRASTFWC